MTDGLKEYNADVKSRSFPAQKHTYPIDPVQLEKFWQAVEPDHDAEKKKQAVVA